MRLKFTRLITTILLLALIGSVPSFAQVNSASLTGLILDPNGAAIANATVKAKNKATNVEQSVKTDSSGYYTFASLPVGTYSLTVETQGFKRAVREEVDLEVGQRARLDFNLEVGAVSEAVLVTADTPMLTTQEASTGGVVENKLISDLPLAARNWDDLLALVPGVQADRFTEQSGGTANGRTGGANVHGVRSLQNNFVLDGVDNNSFSENVQELTTQIVRPSVDSIQEFKVSTNPYSAENGRSPGSLISVTTKSGGNSFHGAAYDFLRNRIFDANDFFSNRSGLKKPQNIQNQFGGAVGGPILKDRLFFFFNYEGTRIRRGVTRLGNVPTANERIGDFSAAAGAANRVTYSPIFDRVGDCRAKVPSAFNADGSFKNNQIPAACFDPLAAKVLGLVPGPNIVPGSGGLNQLNFVRAPGIIDDTDSYTTRVDWQASSRDSVFVRYTNSDRFRYLPGIFGGILDGTGSSANGRLSMAGQSAAIGWTRMIGTRMVNEFRIGWGRNNSSAVQDSFAQQTAKEFGFNGVPESETIGGGLPGIVVSARGGTVTPGGQSGFDRIGSPDFLPKFQKTNQFQWTDIVTFTKGVHQMKGGVDLRLPMRNIYLDVPATRGSFTFDGNRTGIGLADFLLGYPSNAQLTNLFVVDQRLKMYSLFFQDDWKVTPKLTVNLGLRYDYATWPYEGQDRMTNLDLATGLRFTPADSKVGRTLVEPDKNNFAPRIGVAYQLTPKTVVRAGYGRFYMSFERAGSEDQLALNLPFLVNNVVTASNNNTTANNIRLNSGFNLSLDPSAVNPINARLRAVNPESEDGSVDQWNLGVQRELTRSIVFTLDYVGTKGTHLSTLRNLNQPFFNENGTVKNVLVNGVATPLIPYPSLGPIEFRENNGNSMYHGMEASVEKRFSGGLSFGAAYTYSKSIDESQEHLASGGTGSFTQNPANVLGERRGPSDFDVRHRFGMVALYELPFGRGKSYLTEGPLSHILGGWRVSGLAATRSGRPFTVRAGGNDTVIGGPRGGGLVSAWADCLRDGTLDGDKRDIDHWFDTDAYTEPKAPNPTKGNAVEGRLGNCGRNTLRGPRYTNFDFGLARSFDYFGEFRRLELRWEVFNIFNHTQFGLPERNISSSSKGRISALAGDPRVMQFALKFVF
ncbi:MAG TPA: TonB-dependent receptor [Blastocatellia bacterium]|nr:TonB-dependent receptor [Blastocatellia bacterium]